MYRTNEKGLSLIELLIALGLGVFLLGSLIQVFIGGQQSFNVVQAQTSMQEAGRFGADFISRTLRHAGYINPGVAVDNSEFASRIVNINDSDYASAWPAQNGFEESSVVAGTNSAAGPDTLSVRMQPDAEGLLMDCAGNTLDSHGATIVRMTFAVDTNTNELTCQVQGGAAMPLVSGVEDMQVMYGVATDPAQPHLIGKYVNAGDVTVTEWPLVVAVRIGLLAVSNNTPLDSSAVNYTLLDKAVNVSDGRARKVFSQTIALRSKLSG